MFDRHEAMAYRRPSTEFRRQNISELLDLLDRGRHEATGHILHDLLKECTKHKDLAAGRKLSSFMTSNGLYSDTFLNDHLIRMFAACGQLSDACDAFNRVFKPSIYTWNAIISAHSGLGKYAKAFQLYYEMRQRGFQPDVITFLCALKACCDMRITCQGMIIHNHIVVSGLHLHSNIENAVLDMYCKCGNLEEALRVFDTQESRTVVAWGALMAGFVHSLITELGVQAESIDNLLPDMYARCGNFEDAQSVFRLSEQNVDVWASVLARCSEHCNLDYALNLFDMMWQWKAKLNNVIYSSILKICTSACSLQNGRLIHENVIRNRFETDVIVGNKLVDMYAKIGFIEEAHRVFSLLPNRDNVSWSAIITGYVEHGLNTTALELYEKSQDHRVEPTEATLLSILKACGSLGAIARGRLIHDQIIRDDTRQGAALGSSLLNMYAKCGRLQEARKVLDKLPRQDVIAWGALVAGYTRNGHSESAVQAFKDMQVLSLKPDEVMFTNILAACSHTGLVQEGSFHFKSVIEKYDMLPSMEQVSCMIDILGRSGNLREAEDMYLVAAIIYE
ncbi:hypothetical protein L7F22_009966 [Adiantum nelumboides]|nr:hypothetical protein [Adiantum nelumboides]